MYTSRSCTISFKLSHIQTTARAHITLSRIAFISSIDCTRASTVRTSEAASRPQAPPAPPWLPVNMRPKQTNERMNERKTPNERTNERTNRQTDRQTNRQTDRQTDKQTNEQTDRQHTTNNRRQTTDVKDDKDDKDDNGNGNGNDNDNDNDNDNNQAFYASVAKLAAAGPSLSGHVFKKKKRECPRSVRGDCLFKHETLSYVAPATLSPTRVAFDQLCAAVRRLAATTMQGHAGC